MVPAILHRYVCGPSAGGHVRGGHDVPGEDTRIANSIVMEIVTPAVVQDISPDRHAGHVPGVAGILPHVDVVLARVVMDQIVLDENIVRPGDRPDAIIIIVDLKIPDGDMAQLAGSAQIDPVPLFGATAGQ